MATISRSRRALEARSGGKIVRPRRTAGAKTPYERPRRTNPAPENPNWLSRLIFSPTRMIANGAGKLISSVFSADSSSSSSSDDSGSEDNSDDNYNDNDISTQGADKLKRISGTSDMINFFRKDPQPTVGKSLIEQLLMQETFTREECNKLIKVIKSRVVDCHTTEDVENHRLTEIPNSTVGDGDGALLCSTAVMEARKWLTEKKLGSASKSDLDHVIENEVGSPADMAKLYMQARPQWASSSFNQGKSLSPVSAQLFLAETPYSVGGNSLSSSKAKRDTPTIGSWNIHEEIQRVRSKATEEMLRTLPSKRIDWSSFALEKKNENKEANVGDKMHNFSESINASLHTASHGFQVFEKTRDGLCIEASSPSQLNIIPEQNQDDLEVIQTIDRKGEDGLGDTPNTEQAVKLSQDTTNLPLSDAGAGDVHEHKDTNAVDQKLNVMVEGSKDPRSDEENCSTSKEVDGTRNDHTTTNGFPPSGLSAEVVTEQNAMLDNKVHNPISSSHDEVATDVFMDQTCELLSEASDVPNVNNTTNESDGIEDGPQNSLDIYTESSPDQTRPNSKRKLVAKTSEVVEQRGKRLSRYNRRGRGRGT
ncbi:hypothetical protein FNV43_RR12827 [Rhamnella rubrinervis]|uniref:Protein KAKU4 n=1 Tax=Rhamnella rubrinervis TaxID=2594499 RepID=A0A8K0H8E7_9ROSA|nr:hypothetical protein FNV43_RR12827 [Rhamnella rubrinervis]